MTYIKTTFIVYCYTLERGNHLHGHIEEAGLLKALAVAEHAVGAHHRLAEALVRQIWVVIGVGVVQVEDCLALAIDLH